MTNEEEQIITMLFLKHGGFEIVLDLWLFSDDVLTAEERHAFTAYLACDIDKPYGIEMVNDSAHPYLTAEIPLDVSDKD